MDLRSEEVNEFFSIYLFLPTALDPGFYSAANRNEYQKQSKNVSGEKALPACKADSLIAICEPVV
jgi:hypothetical protein